MFGHTVTIVDRLAKLEVELSTKNQKLLEKTFGVIGVRSKEETAVFSVSVFGARID
jgi:hypothetical protein